MTLEIPIPDDDNIVRFGYQERQINPILRSTPFFNPHAPSIEDLYFVSAEEMIAECAAIAIQAAIVHRIKLKRVLDTERAQDRFIGLLKTHDCIQWVNPNSKRYKNKVYLEIPFDGPEQRMPIPDSVGILDYSTQTAGQNVGRTMYLCEGVEIDPVTKQFKRDEKGEIIRGQTHAQIIRDLAVTLEYNRRRITAANLESACFLVKPEDPIIHAPQYPHGTLDGVHLNAAVFSNGTYKEAIVISEEAARKLTCWTYGQQTILVPEVVEDGDGFEMMIETGSQIEPNQVIARHSGVKRLVRWGEYNDTYNAEVREACEVHEIRKMRTIFQGKAYFRYQIIYRARHALETGDKLTTRHGTKGVITVLPEGDLPPGVDICLSPLAVAHRRNMGLFVEMMLNEKALRDGLDHIHVDHFVQHRTHDLLDEGLGKKKRVFWNGRFFDIYAAPVFVVVLDKFAKKTLTYTHRRRHTDQFGMPLDMSALSGAKVSWNEMHLLMADKQMEEFVEKVVMPSFTEEGVATVRNFAHAILGGR